MSTVQNTTVTSPKAGQLVVVKPSALEHRLYDDLTPEQQRLADADAAAVDVTDNLRTIDFGSQEQEALVDVAKQLTEQTKVIDLGEVGKNSLELRKRYEALGVGGLKETAVTKVLRSLPLMGKFVDPMKDFVARQESIGTAIDRIFAAQAQTEQGLRQHHAVVQVLQEENMARYEALTIKTAAAEKALDEAYELARKKAEEYAGTTDPARIRELRLVLKGLELLNHRILTLKTGRFEAINSAQIMDVQLEGIVSLIGMIRNSATVMRQVWQNQVSLAMTNYKMKQGTALLQENREFMNRLMSANVEDLAAVSAQIQTELSSGVIDVGVLTAVAQRTIALQDGIVAKSAEIQRGLQEQGKQVDALVSQVQDASRKSAEVLKALAVERGGDTVPALPQT